MPLHLMAINRDDFTLKTDLRISFCIYIAALFVACDCFSDGFING